MSVNIDLMEYATDALARAAYVANTTYSNVLSGGTPSDDDIHPSTDYQPPKAVDGNTGTRWSTGGATPLPHWWKYDLGAGVTKVITKLRIYMPYNDINAFQLQGSNDNSNWTTLFSYSGAYLSNPAWNDFYFPNTTAYRYYRVYITGSTEDYYVTMSEVQAMEGGGLLVYTESSIKSQGSYALKGIASASTSLNKALTRSVSPTIDLSNQTKITFDIRASRTGSNIKIGIRDSGGTITEITPNILSANVFQAVVWDISAVSNANKDAIDQIIITILNAGADNTFYIDNMVAGASNIKTVNGLAITSIKTVNGLAVSSVKSINGLS